MSFEEKVAWAYPIVLLLTAAVYAVHVFSQLPEVPVAEIAYVRPMITALVITIVAMIIAAILAAVSAPSEADKKDERDVNINRHGDAVGGNVLGFATLLPLGLAMAEVDFFWIANSIYLASIVSGVVSSVVKIVAYRRGF
jgi:hypothetical protein